MSKVYGFLNIKEEVMKSSSGGAFIAICRAFENVDDGEKRYYGAAFDDELNVIHLSVASADRCRIFQGSKYVRSRCGVEIYSAVADDLIKGRRVLFSGTPCQVYALKKYLSTKGVSDVNLLLVDIICHGTPKKQVWDDYKTWLEMKYKSKMTEYSFRYKPEGWKAYPGYAKFENGKTAVNTAETSVFSNLQMQGLITEQGCFKCRFSSQERCGDITLGDFWGVEKIIPQILYKNGVSLVLVNSEKGQNVIDCITKQCSGGQYIQVTDDNRYLEYQHNLRKPTDMPYNYVQFQKDYKALSFNDICRKYAGYGVKYRAMYSIRKFIRKTPLIEWYRSLKKKNLTDR